MLILSLVASECLPLLLLNLPVLPGGADFETGGGAMSVGDAVFVCGRDLVFLL